MSCKFFLDWILHKVSTSVSLFSLAIYGRWISSESPWNRGKTLTKLIFRFFKFVAVTTYKSSVTVVLQSTSFSDFLFLFPLKLDPYTGLLCVFVDKRAAYCHLHLFQFSYKKPHIYEGGTRRCCRSLPLSCWQHCIREVKIEHCRGYPSEACIDRRSVSSEDGEIMEKIDDFWRLLLESDYKD